MASKQHEKDTLCSGYLSSTQDQGGNKKYLDKLDITSQLDHSTRDFNTRLKTRSLEDDSD